MTVSRAQDLKVLAHTTTNATSVTHALDSAAVAGQKIIFGGFCDKATTITPGIGSGLTSRIAASNSALSYFLFEKVAAGGEVNLVAAFGDSSQNACKTFSYVLSADALVDVYVANYSGTAVRSVSTGTTGALGSNPAFAVAAIGTDSVGGVAGGSARSFTNGYSMVNEHLTDPAGTSGIPAMIIGEKSTGFGSTEETTYSYTGSTTDEMGGILVVIRDGAADTTAPSFTDGPQTDTATTSGFNVDGQADEDCTASILITTTGASQPSDAAFDASSEGGAVTAGVAFSFATTATYNGEARRVWVQLVDAAGNRTTTSYTLLLPQTGHQMRVVGTPHSNPTERIDTDPDAVAGDFVQWGDVIGAGSVVVNADLTIVVTGDVTGFYASHGDPADLASGWSVPKLQSVPLGSTDIAAATTSISLSTYPAGVSLGRTIAAEIQSLLLDTFPAAVSADHAIGGTVELLQLATNPAHIALGTNVAAGAESLTVAAYGATIALEGGFFATLEQLVLQTFAAALGVPVPEILGSGLAYTLSDGRMQYTVPGDIRFIFGR